jgi:hypothetical protein
LSPEVDRSFPTFTFVVVVAVGGWGSGGRADNLWRDVDNLGARRK